MPKIQMRDGVCMKKCFSIFIFLLSAYTACASLNPSAPNADILRVPAAHIPAVEEISSDGKKVTSEYRVWVPLYKW